ncbi:MAG: hypothetical protein AVDCRST_MAG95-913 [uncultured Adhaeribacter sp.]|uniref:Uncharacterized protein n=1 Tax=uncultured Adhaeribacter sp. TaxID=448109 RepID=A0A6J4HNI6_9BACT|nr:MAG: hypothetical protein AVDCRST_MAG95-913 [uncultured Adhaeribacter sp.]
MNRLFISGTLLTISASFICTSIDCTTYGNLLALRGWLVLLLRW